MAMMLLSHIEAWVVELERVVNAFEDAVDEVDEVLDEAEQAREYDNAQSRQDRDLRQLENALESALRVAGLVRAANTALDEAIDAARLVVINERLETSKAEGDALDGQLQTAPRITELRHSEAIPDSMAGSLDPLPEGSIVMQGRYRLVQLLQRRPRLHLYLAQHLTDQSLVAMRELVLTGLSPELRRQIERAAFEEFASPLVLGSPHLPGAGDRACIENERHYLVMQLRPARGQRAAIAVTLAGLLLQQPRWPSWLDIGTTVEGVRRLSRVVARLHRMGAILGDLNPGTVLVDAESAAEWAPVMLISWPPPSQFWSDPSNRALPGQVFPIAKSSTTNTFAAPETLKAVGDERSDVYSLGAILYLLLTGYAPTSALLRQRCSAMSNFSHAEPGGSALLESIELIPPHLLNGRLPTALENIVVCALDLDPAARYDSVFSLAEALEAMNPFPSFPKI